MCQYLEDMRQNHNNLNFIRQKMGNANHLPFWEKVIDHSFPLDERKRNDEKYRTHVGESSFDSSWEVGSPEQIEKQEFLNLETRPNLFPKPTKKACNELYEKLKIFHKEYSQGFFGPIILILEDSVIYIYGNKVRWFVPGFMVPKSNGKWRQIRDFADEWTNDNPDKNSINSFADPEEAMMSTASQADVGAFTLQHSASAKLDLTNAFRHRRIAPMCAAGQVYLILGFNWRGRKAYYAVVDFSYVMGRSITPNCFSTLLNLLVKYLSDTDAHNWRTDPTSYKSLKELGLHRQKPNRVFYPRRPRLKFFKKGPKDGQPMSPTRPWNCTANRHFMAFITKCKAPLSLILLDDSITGDNNRGIIIGDQRLEAFAKILVKKGGFTLNRGYIPHHEDHHHVHYQCGWFPGLGLRS